MVVVRDIFQVQFGKAREAIDILKDGQKHLKSKGYEVSRLLADVTGEFYTLVMESTYDSLSTYEASLAQVSQDQDWKDAYSRFVPLVKSGRREVFRVVE